MPSPTFEHPNPAPRPDPRRLVPDERRPRPTPDPRALSRRRPLITHWLAALTASLLAAACQSEPPGPRVGGCTLAPGMTSDELALCGCVPAYSSSYPVVITDPEDRGNEQSVIIINYLCALGSQGVAKVVVVNGIAEDVYY